MGFNVHAVGTGGFRYTRSNIPHGERWDLQTLEKQLFKRVVGPLRSSPTGGSVRQAIGAQSRIHQVSLLTTTIELLMIHGDGRIDINVRHDHFLRPSTSRFLGTRLNTTSGLPIARELLGFLDRADMNSWGPVLEVIHALALFDADLRGASDFQILIILTD